MSKKTVFLTRHGETHWNTVRRIQGHLDSPLTPFGEQQGVWLKDRLIKEHIDIIFTSPLQRAYATARIIAGDREIPIISCDLLKEINLGSWEGMLLEEVDALNPIENYKFWNEPDKYIPIDGESFQALRERSEQFYHEYLVKTDYSTILVVTHAIALKSLLAYSKGNPISELWKGEHIQPTSLTKGIIREQEIEYEYIGDISHHQSKSSHSGWFSEE